MLEGKRKVRGAMWSPAVALLDRCAARYARQLWVGARAGPSVSPRRNVWFTGRRVVFDKPPIADPVRHFKVRFSTPGTRILEPPYLPKRPQSATSRIFVPPECGPARRRRAGPPVSRNGPPPVRRPAAAVPRDPHTRGCAGAATASSVPGRRLALTYAGQLFPP